MARYPIKMLLDKDLGPFIPYLPSNAVVVEGSNETVADQIIDLHNEIDEKIANVYRYKGSVLYANLPTEDMVTGDVYNILDDFELEGRTYPAGTNIAWATDHWDPLTGLFSLDSSFVTLDLNIAIMAAPAQMNNTAITAEANKNAIMKAINDCIKNNKTILNFITTQDSTGYFFSIYIPSTHEGTQDAQLTIDQPIKILYGLKYGDKYWIAKKLHLVFTNGYVTNITITANSEYTANDMLYPRVMNTTAFTPTADYNLANKKYVDDGLSLKEALVNKVTSILSTSTDTEYPSAKAVFDLINNTKSFYEMPTHSSIYPLIIEDLKPGVYMNYNASGPNDRLYFKAHAADTTVAQLNDIYPWFLFVFKKLEDVTIPQSGLSEVFITCLGILHEGIFNNGKLMYKDFKLDTNGLINTTSYHLGQLGALITDEPQIFMGLKAFNTVPELSKNVTDIAQPFHIPNRKYVDYCDLQSISKIESSYPLSVIDNTGNLMYDIAHDTAIMTPITALVNKAYKNSDYTTGPLYFYNIYEDNIYYKIEMDLNKSDLANHNKIIIKPVYTAALLQRLNTGKGYWTEAVFTTSSWTSLGFSKFVYDATAGISGDILNVLVTNNMEPYTPTLDYAPANKKYVDDAIKGTDLSQYVELSQSNPGISLSKVRYANIGDSFSLAYIASTTVDTIATAFYVKLPASHYYKTLPSAYTYEPMGAVTYFEYDSQTQSADPKNAYGYLTYNPSNPDYVEIKIYPVDYNGQIGILANSYFYVNCNWIRI